MSLNFLDERQSFAHMSAMSRSQATPVLVDQDNQQGDLERIRLGNGVHDERWLQALIHNHPTILPVTQIEPAFGDLLAAAMEVPCGHGFIDNLYLTPTGDIVLVETKLWRNPQMRREVVAQALDYVAAISAMSFEDFESAVRRGQSAPAKLYDLVSHHADALDEADFIDAVARNLQRGRVLVMVLGDGVRTETELLSDLLQSHAGSHFTFALVELAAWRHAQTGSILAIPSTLAKTVMIERGVVRVENGTAVVRPVTRERQGSAETISSARFWEKIAERSPALPAAIRAFVAALEPLGVFADLKSSLNFKVDLPDRAKPVSFGYIMRNGQFWTDHVNSGLPEHVWRPYLEQLAALIGGQVTSGVNKYVSVDGRSAPRIEQFLPLHQDALVDAIQTMLKTLGTENDG